VGGLAHWPLVVSTRRRLGVALLLDPPVADAVDGLRRAVGDPSLGRVGPHVTLVPPINVRADQLGAALEAVRAAAAAQAGPLTLTLGPPATFLPDNPVLYLEVGGDLEALRDLRDAVFVAPLARSLTWPWIPHVTLADTADEDRIVAAVAALDRFTAVARVEHIVLLHEMPGRIWVPLADAALGPRVVVGRGGLALEITRGRTLDPEVLQMIGDAGAPPDRGEGGAAPTGGPSFPLVLSGRRERQIAGVAAAWRADDGGHVAVLVRPGARGQGIGGILLAQLEAAVRVAGWECPVLHADGPAGFYQARSGWAVPSRTAPTRTEPAS
jgi:2'-5' RNA ligase